MTLQQAKELQSWVPIPNDSDFPLFNLPLGVFSRDGEAVSCGTRIGDTAIDLSALQQLGYFDAIDLPDDVFMQDTLNDFIALGKDVHRAWRKEMIALFSADEGRLRDNEAHRVDALFNVSEVEMMMPVFVQDYTDFYSSKEHATNVGIMFRGKENALMPNWLHIPVGYHGRASSIVVSGVDLNRPKGQQLPADAETPVFGPSKMMDFELEMAFITTEGKPLGHRIKVDEAEDYIFGMVVFNDWSARDIQKWEYVPLGPFLGKNFGSSISPWIVTLDALDIFRCKSPEQSPQPLPYLQGRKDASFDINLQVDIQPQGSEPTTVCRSNFKYLYWSMAQQLAHHTVNGCNINAGDMMASGTISGPTEDSFGSMLELSWKGTKPLTMNDGSERKFLLDNDTVIMKAHCEQDGFRLGFGEVKSTILPAIND
ncbi:MAG: fumarylacetoacetase [Cryomorphaceae bacterium]|nr:fumarylacetoacetase [Cryomorphaceae bacterium]